ncbi:hypothetical protein V8E36_006094 [Tilletia maclaganii]
MNTPLSASGSAYGGLGASASASGSGSGSNHGLAYTPGSGISPSATGIPTPASPLSVGGPAVSSLSAAAASMADAQQGGSSSAVSSAPGPVRSAAGSPRPKFDTDSLSTFLRTHLSARLTGVSWNARERDKTRALTSGIAQAAKAKMLEIAPKGFKFVVNVQLVENLGQGGRGDVACHWEESDQVVQELFSNDRILCTVTCFAIRAF